VSVTVELSGLTKRFGSLTAVDDLSFTVAPGRVTGFLGPNGAGKTTTLRMLLGLVRPTSGSATIGGRTYAELDEAVINGAQSSASDVRLSWWGGAVALVVWAAAFAGVGIARVLRQDIS
jgi:ABC-type branched-subunit amino acid transport system ATPase component